MLLSGSLQMKRVVTRVPLQIYITTVSADWFLEKPSAVQAGLRELCTGNDDTSHLVENLTGAELAACGGLLHYIKYAWDGRLCFLILQLYISCLYLLMPRVCYSAQIHASTRPPAARRPSAIHARPAPKHGCRYSPLSRAHLCVAVSFLRVYIKPCISGAKRMR